MTDQSPADYLRELQSIEAERGLGQLRTLALEFAATLDELPGLKAELDSFLVERPGVDYDALALRVEAALVKAAELLLDFDHLPKAIKADERMQHLIKTAAKSMGSRTVAGTLTKLAAVRDEVKADLAASAKKAAEPPPPAPPPAKPKVPTPELIAIPAGRYTMGFVKARDEGTMGGVVWADPAHEVQVAAFHLGKTLVTFDQYDAFCAATKRGLPSDSGWGRGKRPVINVKWQDAGAYVDWLSEITEKHWRLPNEAEWEYAARAASTTAFPWGMEADSRYANFGGAVGKTTPVGQYPANGWGLFDMHGNVWEWLQDPWHDSYVGAPSVASVWGGGTAAVGLFVVARGTSTPRGCVLRSATTTPLTTTAAPLVSASRARPHPPTSETLATG